MRSEADTSCRPHTISTSVWAARSLAVTGLATRTHAHGEMPRRWNSRTKGSTLDSYVFRSWPVPVGILGTAHRAWRCAANVAKASCANVCSLPAL